MSQEREMLEMAARAAGIFLTPKTLAEVYPKWKWTDDFELSYTEEDGLSGTVVTRSYDGELSGTTRENWNPLTSDGDAFRLAVALGIKVLPYPIYAETKHSVAVSRLTMAPPHDDENTFVGPELVEIYNSDPLAATRLAITRAAASIGEKMRDDTALRNLNAASEAMGEEL